MITYSHQPDDRYLSGGKSDPNYVALIDSANVHGLYERTLVQYGATVIVALMGIVLSLYIVTLTDSIWIQSLNALIFAFFSTQMGIVGHDLSHGMVFRSARLNRICALITWGFFCGLSESRWFEKHNMHHQYPNYVGHDPDLAIPFMFSAEQVQEKPQFLRTYLLPVQHFAFWPGLIFVYPMYIMLGMIQYIRLRSPLGAVELTLAIVHFVALGFFLLYFLPLFTAIAFGIIALVAIGIYMAAVFAPNHKGCPETPATEEYHWHGQIINTRGLTPSWPLFYILGGLSYQIEHHIFPSMSRFKYAKARELAMKYCSENGIVYHETTWVASLAEMYYGLKKQSRGSKTVLF